VVGVGLDEVPRLPRFVRKHFSHLLCHHPHVPLWINNITITSYNACLAPL
jgi:hypothetical protein